MPYINLVLSIIVGVVTCLFILEFGNDGASLIKKGNYFLGL